MSIVCDLLFCTMIFVVLYGYMSYFNRRFRIAMECLPIIIFSGIGSLIFLAGILNIMELMFWLIVVGGGVLALRSVVRRQYPEKSIGLLCLLILAVYLLIFLNSQKFYHYDNFSHWCLIVKSLWLESKFPNFENPMITYQAYPVGSACFIWFVCKFLGFTEGHVMFAQSMLTLSCAGPLFAFARNETKIKKMLMGAVAYVGGVFLVSYGSGLGNGIHNAMVDSLLAAVAVAACAIVLLYKDQIVVAVWCVMPLLVLEVCIKNSGIMWVVAITIEIICFSGAKIKEAKLIKSLCALLAITGGYIYLWKAHIALVFAHAETSNHAMSLENYQTVLGNKSSEDIEFIKKLFLQSFFSSKETLWWMLGGVIGVLILAKIFQPGFMKNGKILFGCIYSIVIVLLYQSGNFAMYLFSMPMGEAKVLAGYDRYVMTLRAFIWGIMLLMLIQLIQQTDWKERLFSNWHTLVMAGLLLGTVVRCNGKDVENWIVHPQFIQGREASRTHLDNIIDTYNLEQNKRSLIYIAGPPDRDVGYRRYMSKYLLWPNQLQTVNTEEIHVLDNFMQYDYLVFLERDAVLEEWLVNNGLPADTECIKTADVEYRKAADAIRELNQENYLSIISVSDDASVSFTDEMAESMHSIGLQYDLTGCYRQGYIAIIDAGEIIYEAVGEERLEYSGDVSGVHCDVVSAGFIAGKESSIILDGVENSNDQRGMNIVIYDKEQQMVVNSTTFDTWARDGHYVMK